MIVIKHRKSPDVVLLRVNAPQLDDRDLTGAYLLGADMARLRGHRVVLHGANLRNAELCGADLQGANLWRADLRCADLRGINLSGATLAEADLRGANLQRADLRGADLSRALLLDADLSDVWCDTGTRWPEGEGWGLVAGPPREIADGVTRRRIQVRWADAQQCLHHRLAGWRNQCTQRTSPVALLGPTLRLTTAGAAMLLLVAALADIEVDLGHKPTAQQAPTPVVTASLPKPVAAVPERADRDNASEPKPAPRVALQPPTTRSAPQPAPIVHVRMARARVLHTHPRESYVSRSAPQRLDRPAQLASQAPTMPRSGRETTTFRPGHSGRVVLAAARIPVRPRTRFMPESPEVTQPEQTATRATAEPAKVAQTATLPEPAPVQRPAEPSPRSKPRQEPRNRPGQLAWGNRAFHYGSGYDIYSMHLEQNSE